MNWAVMDGQQWSQRRGNSSALKISTFLPTSENSNVAEGLGFFTDFRALRFAFNGKPTWVVPMERDNTNTSAYLQWAEEVESSCFCLDLPATILLSVYVLRPMLKVNSKKRSSGMNEPNSCQFLNPSFLTGWKGMWVQDAHTTLSPGIKKPQNEFPSPRVLD